MVHHSDWDHLLYESLHGHPTGNSTVAIAFFVGFIPHIQYHNIKEKPYNN
ncbi:hypothetical protein FEDK69T_03100 [Flavobacterium enshiense DK69]|nr:hypothetical protein [Flavobacterium enshiense]ESU24758.1 hypothetical protein FEDK69T_03100 [Flavobacterium enshiense DK69]